MKRIYAIDFARGLVMIITALDHTRDLFHVSSLTQDPTDLSTTTPLLFFTRWVTHFCAPIFVFLSGTSAYLSLQSKGNIATSRRFLLRRGGWLLGLEFTVVSLGIWFDLQFRALFFQVIGAIGVSFMVLALLLKTSPRFIGLLGLLIIVGHNLLSLIPGPDFPFKNIVSALISPQVFQITPQRVFMIGYPPVPWLGIMLVGFAFGRILAFPAAQRKRLFLGIGFTAVVLFTLIRLSNFYGDPAPWSEQKSTLFTFLSFLNTTKYPPSLLYALMTLSILFLMLSLVDGVTNLVIRVITVYGQVPLFYYIIHWYLLHTLLLITLFLQGFRWSDLEFGAFRLGRPQQASGVELGIVYLVWLAVVIALYPVCRWYARYKASHPENEWLRYL